MLRDLEAFLRYVTLIAVRCYLLTYTMVWSINYQQILVRAYSIVLSNYQQVIIDYLIYFL